MVSLACSEHPHFVPSLAEAVKILWYAAHYSVDTVRYFRTPATAIASFSSSRRRFLDIPCGRKYETLLGLCDFIIANRPAFVPKR